MSKRLKVPKKIAGIKIPKSVRKGPVGLYLCSSTAQQSIAEALLFAGETLSDQASSSPAQESPNTGSLDGVPSGGVFVDDDFGLDREQGGHAEQRLAHAFTEALRTFRAVLAEHSQAEGGESAEQLRVPRQ